MKHFVAQVRLWIILLAAAMALAASIAQAASESPVLTLSAPTSTHMGEALQVKAQLVDAAGRPVSNAPIIFTLPSTFFLGTRSDVVLGRAVTDRTGWAQAEFKLAESGEVTIRAEFQGNERFSPVKTTALITVDAGSGQLYHQEAGVQIPGLTAAPAFSSHSAAEEHGGQARSGLAALWPMMSFWPIGLVLLIVWSLYAFVVLQVFRIARAGSEPSVELVSERLPVGGLTRQS